MSDGAFCHYCGRARCKCPPIKPTRVGFVESSLIEHGKYFQERIAAIFRVPLGMIVNLLPRRGFNLDIEKPELDRVKYRKYARRKRSR